MNIKILKAAVAGLVLSVSGFANAGIIPFGIQSNVSQATLDGWGWSECHRSSYNANIAESSVTGACTGDYLMMGLWDFSLGAYGVLGAGETSTVTALTYDSYSSDNGGTTLNNFSNGLNFYRTANSGSWGFTTNTITELNSADILLFNGLQSQNGQVEVNLSTGLSFHTNSGNFTDGWAYNTTGSNFTSMSSGDQRVFFQYTQVPEPSTLAIFALGIMGLASRRLNKQ